MPSISNKGHMMPESPIRKLVPFAEAAVKEGKKVLHLNIGQPDIPSPKEALDAVKNAEISVLEYSHSAGIESYRKGLSKYYKGVGIDIDYENIMVTTGGSEALLLGFMSCLDEGDEVIIPEPFYANYNGFATSAGVKVTPVTASIEDGFALPPISDIEDLLTERTKAILICNPGNPTGYLYTKEELEALRDIVERYDLFLFADEVYREFIYDGKEHHSVMNLKGIEDNVVLVDSVSKRYSMCGARIGALVSRNHEVISTAMKFAQARLSPPTLAQIAAEGALKTPKSYFTNVIKEYSERRDLLVEGLNQIQGVVCPKPTGAFYCVAELPVMDAERFCQWMLDSFEYDGYTVMMAPAAGFYSNPEHGKRQVRIAYVLDKERLKKALECLAAALKDYPGKLSNA
jgi:aspartate aminotransferase